MSNGDCILFETLFRSSLNNDIVWVFVDVLVDKDCVLINGIRGGPTSPASTS